MIIIILAIIKSHCVLSLGQAVSYSADLLKSHYCIYVHQIHKSARLLS